MARNTSISLGDHFSGFIDSQVEAALIEGDQSGEPQPFDNEAFKARMRAVYGRMDAQRHL